MLNHPYNGGGDALGISFPHVFLHFAHTIFVIGQGGRKRFRVVIQNRFIRVFGGQVFVPVRRLVGPIRLKKKINGIP